MLRSLPNALTVFRIAAAPAGAAMMVMSAGADMERSFAGLDLTVFRNESAALGVAAFVLFLAGAVTDMLDGWIARRLGAVSRAGAILDPIADKVFVAFWLFAWVWILGVSAIVIVPAAAIISRDIMMTVLRLQRLHVEAVPIPVSFDAKMKTLIEFVMLALPFAAGFLAEAGTAPTDWFFIETWLAFLWFSAALSLYTAIRYLLPRKPA